jgi:hypothetical protein
MDLDTEYWIFAGISLACWFLVYTTQIYSRFKNVNNISFYLTVLWFLSDALVLFCSIIIFQTIKSIVVIEVLVFVFFDIFSIGQYIYLKKSIEKKKIVFLITIIIIYIILCLCGYFFREIIVPLTWLSILVLIVSRFPQIHQCITIKIPNPKLLISTLLLTILANSSFYISILIDISRKNNANSLIPWLVCKVLIICLDISLIFIIYYKNSKNTNENENIV